MKDQYVGDINDYRKYALLRTLAGPGDIRMDANAKRRSADGGMTKYLENQSVWRSHDPDLFDVLRAVIEAPDKRHLALIEASGIVPGAQYFDDVIPNNEEGRLSFFQAALAKFAQSDLIFFDPDNGLDVPSKKKGKRDSCKFIYRDEVTAIFNGGKSILLYQHFTREERCRFVGRIGGSLKDLMPCFHLGVSDRACCIYVSDQSAACGDTRVPFSPCCSRTKSPLRAKQTFRMSASTNRHRDGTDPGC